MKKFLFITLSLLNLFSFSQHLKNDVAKEVFFNDLNIMMNNNNDGFSFGETIANADKLEDKYSTLSSDVFKNEKNNILNKAGVGFGEEIALSIKFNEIVFNSSKNDYTDTFFPNNPGGVELHTVYKFYFGKKNDYKLKPNIYKIITLYTEKYSDYISTNDVDNYFDKILDYTKNQFIENEYTEHELEGDHNRYNYKFYNYSNSKYPNLNFDILYSSIFVKNELVNNSKSYNDFKIPSYIMHIGRNTFGYNNLVVPMLYVEISTIGNDSEKIYSDINNKYLINDKDMREINTYQINEMISMFIDDCEINGIQINKNQNIRSEFIELEGQTVGVAYAINDDENIVVAIDPVKWKNTPFATKWYIIYHELGHDILNLRHGDGGKMMFNFVNRKYTWEEFLEDKNYMFKVYKDKN